MTDVTVRVGKYIGCLGNISLGKCSHPCKVLQLKATTVHLLVDREIHVHSHKITLVSFLPAAICLWASYSECEKSSAYLILCVFPHRPIFRNNTMASPLPELSYMPQTPKRAKGVRWPSGLERWPGLATGCSWVRIPLLQFRFGTLAIPFVLLCQCLSDYARGSKRPHLSELEMCNLSWTPPLFI